MTTGLTGIEQMEGLEHELLVHIAEFCEPDDLCNLRLVQRRFRLPCGAALKSSRPPRQILPAQFLALVQAFPNLTSLDMRECCALTAAAVTQLQGLTLLRTLVMDSGLLEQGGGSGHLSALNLLSSLQLRPEVAPFNLPEGMRDMTALEMLSFVQPGVLNNLAAVSNGIVALSRLRYMNLSRSALLVSLPDGISGLTALRKLDLFECAALVTLPEGISSLGDLEELDLSFCSNLASLPAGISGLSSLRGLSLSHCRALGQLPGGISGLGSLGELDLGYCSALITLPPAISVLQLLDRLSTEGCTGLTFFPEGMTRLRHLRRWNLRGCIGVRELYLDGFKDLEHDEPEGLGSLSSLKLLSLYNLPGASLSANLTGLSRLEVLWAVECRELTTLFLSGLRSLRVLGICGCPAISLPAEQLSSLLSLEVLALVSCRALDPELPKTLEALTRLYTIFLYECPSITTIPPRVAEIPSLAHLIVVLCSAAATESAAEARLAAGKFKGDLYISNLPLQSIHWGEQLATILPGSELVRGSAAGNAALLPALRELFLGRAFPGDGGDSPEGLCIFGEDFPPPFNSPDELSQLANLRYLQLFNLNKVEEFPAAFSCLTSLQTFLIGGCPALKRLPECLPDLEYLLSLGLMGLDSLEGFPPCLALVLEPNIFQKGLAVAEAPTKLIEWIRMFPRLWMVLSRKIPGQALPFEVRGQRHSLFILLALSDRAAIRVSVLGFTLGLTFLGLSNHMLEGLLGFRTLFLNKSPNWRFGCRSSLFV